MNLFKNLKINGSFAAATACIAALSFSASNAQACNGALNSATNAVGTHNNFYYSFWRQTNSSNVQIGCNNEPGYFSTNWSNVFNWVGGMGWNPGGPRTVNYTGTFHRSGNRNTNSYLALYGWTRKPTEVEYYVIESYGTYNPAQCGGASGGGVPVVTGDGDGYKGAVTIGGVRYLLTQCTRTNQPSISGTSTFKQFFSVRENPLPWGSVQGSIDVQAHFNAWANAGMRLGNDFAYMVLATEGYGGNSRNSSGDAELWISEGPGGPGNGPVGCGNQNGTPVCCHVEADPNGDGFGEEDGEMCVVTDATQGNHPPNPSNVLAAINVGGTGDAIQMDGVWYEPNSFVEGGNPNSTTQSIQPSNNAIHQSEMYGEYTVEIPVDNQTVTVDLGFVEMYSEITSPGGRVFSVVIEGQTVLSNFDIFSQAGGQYRLLKPGPFEASVNDGALTIEMEANVENPTLSSILVTRGGLPASSSSSSSSSLQSSSSSSAVSSTPPVQSSSAASSSSAPTNPQPPTTTGGSVGHWLLMLLGGCLVLADRKSVV